MPITVLNRVTAYRPGTPGDQARYFATPSQTIASADTDHERRDRSNDLSSWNPVLIVDDDQSMRDMLTRYFADHDIPARSASDHRDFVCHFAAASFSVILLDLKLGDDNGLDILREIRSNSGVPVIIISGQGLEDVDRVIGLELGADDYILKPFSLRELLARVRAVLRRQEIGCAISASRHLGRRGYRFGCWQLDCHTRRLVYPDGTNVALRRSEYSLLLAFLEAPRRVLSRLQLMQATRTHEDVFDRSIDVRVLRLRRILEIERGAPRVIQTERGIGYVFALGVERF